MSRRFTEPTAALPLEFRLVAQCCRWPIRPDEPLVIGRSRPRVDWPRLARIARRHRVEGLVWNRLRAAAVDVPPETASALKSAAERIAHSNLRAALECARLNAAFRNTGVPLLFVKGVTLAMLAYGTLALKAGWDIDLLVDRKQLGAAAGILSEAGYCCIQPSGADIDRLRRWHEMAKESVWRKPADGSVVELHTALADNELLIPGIGLETRQSVALPGGIRLPTLSRDELFAYLCVHGASSAWFRLKWLADLAALVAQSPPSELDRLYGRAVSLGAGRTAAMALLLATRLLQLPIPDALLAEIEADRLASAMAWIALRKMSGRYVEVEIHRFALGTLSIKLVKLLLLPGWRFASSEARRQIADLRNRRAFEAAGRNLVAGPLYLLVRKLAEPLRKRRS